MLTYLLIHSFAFNFVHTGPRRAKRSRQFSLCVQDCWFRSLTRNWKRHRRSIYDQGKCCCSCCTQLALHNELVSYLTITTNCCCCSLSHLHSRRAERYRCGGLLPKRSPSASLPPLRTCGRLESFAGRWCLTANDLTGHGPTKMWSKASRKDIDYRLQS